MIVNINTLLCCAIAVDRQTLCIHGLPLWCLVCCCFLLFVIAHKHFFYFVACVCWLRQRGIEAKTKWSANKGRTEGDVPRKRSIFIFWSLLCRRRARFCLCLLLTIVSLHPPNEYGYYDKQPNNIRLLYNTKVHRLFVGLPNGKSQTYGTPNIGRWANDDYRTCCRIVNIRRRRVDE